MTDRTEQLNTIIRDRIRKGGGWIRFDEFMQAALYEPELGYYESSQAFGEQGDFVTGVSMGPWLALALTDLIYWGWKNMGEPEQWHLIEQGGGEGKLLLDVVNILQDSSMPQPAQIIAVESSKMMRQRQKKHYDQAGVIVTQYSRLTDVSVGENCLMFCNELLDAMPVRCFEYSGNGLYERGVVNHAHGFGWQKRTDPLEDSTVIPETITSTWPEKYSSEWNPNLELWQQDVASVVQRGYVFCVDYGYARSEYYRSQRHEGTLLGHKQHQVSEDVLSLPGSMDITAHIDFSSLRASGLAYEMQPIVFMTQGAWLAQSPSVQKKIESMATEPGQHLDEIAHIKRLMLPFGMGELFKLYLQARHVPNNTPPHLSSFNRLGLL
ncbi:MAG: class I SAM-dependent methyltransferase [Mariprofundaceae bacterium]